jgi:hypothetical protein
VLVVACKARELTSTLASLEPVLDESLAVGSAPVCSRYHRNTNNPAHLARHSKKSDVTPLRVDTAWIHWGM